MPTQQTTYNSRVTDEALEKKFRDTFKSQGGAELVDDLYAQGVIVPIVDFTAAAQGSELRADLQNAWDFATEHSTITNTSINLIQTPGFWKVGLNVGTRMGSTQPFSGSLRINDGATTKVIWEFNTVDVTNSGLNGMSVTPNEFVVFLRSGDRMSARSDTTELTLDVWYRQIADVNGNLTNPLGFTSS